VSGRIQERLPERRKAMERKGEVNALVLVVDHGHQRRRRRKNLVNKDEDGTLRSELDTLANDVDELSRRSVSMDERGEEKVGRRTCPTVRSAGTRYFFLSIAGMSVLSAFSQMTCEGMDESEGFMRRTRRGKRTGMRSGYF
jgi:hypothetical protein